MGLNPDYLLKYFLLYLTNLNSKEVKLHTILDLVISREIRHRNKFDVGRIVFDNLLTVCVKLSKKSDISNCRILSGSIITTVHT